MKFFLCVVGGIMVIEGLPYFVFPEKMKMWIQKLQEWRDYVALHPRPVKFSLCDTAEPI